MTIHKEGFTSIAIGTILFGAINLLSFYLISYDHPILSWIIFFATLGLLIFLISFFRIPKRQLTIEENAIVAPADGTVVVIEEVQPDEYFIPSCKIMPAPDPAYSVNGTVKRFHCNFGIRLLYRL